MNPSLSLYMNNDQTCQGKVHGHFLMDIQGYQVNSSFFIRKVKVFPEVPQWANFVTCPSIASIVEDRKGEGDLLTNNVYNLAIEMLSPWSMDVYILTGIIQSLSTVVSI